MAKITDFKAWDKIKLPHWSKGYIYYNECGWVSSEGMVYGGGEIESFKQNDNWELYKENKIEKLNYEKEFDRNSKTYKLISIVFRKINEIIDKINKLAREK